MFKSHLENRPMKNRSEVSSKQQLALLSTVSRALVEATTLSEIKEIRDKAEAVRHYVKSAALGLVMQNQAAELKLRAERKAGGVLAELCPHGGDRKSKSPKVTLILKDLGINKNQSSKWQQEA